MSKVPVPRPRREHFRILALPLARIPRTRPSSSSVSEPSTSTPNSSNSSLSPEPSTTQSIEPNASTSSSAAQTSGTSVKGSSNTPLLLFHVCQPDPSPEKGPPSLPTRLLNKASDTWINLGQKDPKSWTFWFYKKGESLMDRIEYEEWALKAIHEGRGVKIDKEGKPDVVINIPLLKPTLIETPLPTLLPKLHRFLIHRIPYHRKMMWRSLLFSPVTWPFAIIPVIPNFPLFYVLWRAWSHYKAWKGAHYLESLLKLGMIKEQSSAELDRVYKSSGIILAESGDENKAPDSTSSAAGATKSKSGDKKNVTQNHPGGEKVPSQATGEGAAPDGTTTPEEMVYEPASSAKHPSSENSGTVSGEKKPLKRYSEKLLSLNQVKILAKTFDLRGQEIMDVNRAVEQAEARARAADVKMAETAGSNEESKDEKSSGQKPGTNWRGNLHR